MTELQDEVTYVLETIRALWPERRAAYGDSYGASYGEDVPDWPGVVGDYGEEYSANYGGTPGPLVRIDRDEPEILETGERRRSVELSNFSAIGASLSNRETSPRGTEFDHDVETVVSVRVEGLHAVEHGQIGSRQAFDRLVTLVKLAILADRSYPNVDADDETIGFVCYQDSRIENEQNLSSENRDYFRTDFDVRLTGVEQLPDL